MDNFIQRLKKWYHAASLKLDKDIYFEDSEIGTKISFDQVKSIVEGVKDFENFIEQQNIDLQKLRLFNDLLIEKLARGSNE